MNDLRNYTKWNLESLPEDSGIYCLENSINNKLYIGQAQKIKTRIRYHKNSKDDLPIHRAIRKYGIDNFNIYILEFTTIDNLSNIEIHFIKKFQSNITGYNLTKGGEGLQGYTLSEDIKNKISEATSKETWAYNFKEDYFISSTSRLELCLNLNQRNVDINVQNIYDAINNKSYSKNFTFGNTKEEAFNTYKQLIELNKLQNNIYIYLYNYKTNKYSPEFNSFSDAEQYIKLFCSITNGHLFTAYEHNNKYVKDFLFGISEKSETAKNILEEKINTFKPYVYLYNISENVLMRFESNISEICRKLEEMNFHINRTSFDKVLKNKQKQAGGFIMAYSVNELISKVLNYNAESCQNIFNLAKENDYLNDQDLINWQDKLNEISVAY